MTSITLPQITPQTRSQQCRVLDKAHLGDYLWLVGTRVELESSNGKGRELVWVPAMLPSGYVPYLRVTQRDPHRQGLLTLFLLTECEGWNVQPFLMRTDELSKFSPEIILYEWPYLEISDDVER